MVEDPRLKEMSVSIRGVPFEQRSEKKQYLVTGEETGKVAIFLRLIRSLQNALNSDVARSEATKKSL